MTIRFLTLLTSFFLSGLVFAQQPLPLCVSNIERFQQVHPFLFRGAQPELPQDLECIKSLGVKTIIDLVDSPPELIEFENTLATSLGLKFYSFPLSGFFSPPDESITSIFRELLNAENQPVFIHCHAGKDRTGLIIGLYRVWMDHWDPNQAWGEMLSLGFSKYLLGLNYYYWTHLTR